MATYLIVPFTQKDRVKALGAKWDASQRQWFVPPGLDLAQFSTWLPEQASRSSYGPPTSHDLVAAAQGTLAPAAPAGVSLSQLLAGVERGVNLLPEPRVLAFFCWFEASRVRVTARERTGARGPTRAGLPAQARAFSRLE